MRKTLTITFLLAASLMCSFLSLGQRPYIPDEPLHNPNQSQNNPQNQIGDSVLRQLRALLGDRIDEEQPNQNNQNNQSNQSVQNNQSTQNNQNTQTDTISTPQQSPTPTTDNTSSVNPTDNSSNNNSTRQDNPNNHGIQPIEVITDDIFTPLQAPYIEDVNTQESPTSDVNTEGELYDLLQLFPESGNSSTTTTPSTSEKPTQGNIDNSASDANTANGPTIPSQSVAPVITDPSSTVTTPANSAINNQVVNNSNSQPTNISSASSVTTSTVVSSQTAPIETAVNINTQSNPIVEPNVVVYPKIRATVGSEIIVEPAQAIRNTPVQQWPQSQQGQNLGQQPITSGGNTNVYTGVGDVTTYNPYSNNAPSQQTPKVSELYTIVDGDTVSVILPQRNLGRFDRGLYNYLYIPKGRWAFGLTASYGEFNTEDVELLNILKDFDVKGKLYSINPFITYFFRNNQSMGMRLNYTRGEADLSSMVFDFDEDMAFDLKDLSYYYEGYSMSVFYRNYVGLGRNSRFSVFNDIDLCFSSGSSRFKRYYDQVTRDTQTVSMGVALNFSPGVCVFIMDNAAFNVSFGVFGVSMHKEKQMTDGVEEGSRFSSGANFKFNLFNINFGLMIVI